jgi:translation elongation factor P/translation initiation factor 5A
MKITVKSARVHLQGHGMQNAVPVQDLKPGMVTMWNGGWTAEIEGIKSSKSGKTHQIIYKGGKVDHRRMRTGRLVAIA